MPDREGLGTFSAIFYNRKGRQSEQRERPSMPTGPAREKRPAMEPSARIGQSYRPTGKEFVTAQQDAERAAVKSGLFSVPEQGPAPRRRGKFVNLAWSALELPIPEEEQEIEEQESPRVGDTQSGLGVEERRIKETVIEPQQDSIPTPSFKLQGHGGEEVVMRGVPGIEKGKLWRAIGGSGLNLRLDDAGVIVKQDGSALTYEDYGKIFISIGGKNRK